MVIHIENHSLENARRGPVVKRQNDRAKCPSPCASREIRLNGSLGFLQMDTGLVALRQTKKEKKEGEIMKSLKANLSMLFVAGVRSMGSGGRRVP